MQVFVYEYNCSRCPDSALRTEGWAMLRALLEDFSRVPHVETSTLLHESCTQALPPRVHRFVTPANEAEAFHALARAADYTLVIAPEFDGILLARCRWVLDAGSRLLGPSPPAVELTGDKLALGRHFQDCGVPTPASYPADPEPVLSSDVFPLVWKPRHGAGSQATFLVRGMAELRQSADRARKEGWEGEALLQRYTPGLAASVAFLIGPRRKAVLAPAAQRLSEDGRFHYLGGVVPLSEDLALRALFLAERAVAAVPGLHGYVGVDLVLGRAVDGRQDVVIEINPRPTTSYVGLRALARENIAECMLALAEGQEVARLRWYPGTVQFRPDGSVRSSLYSRGALL
jgi:predicted ATP-grasp superfamily ATP-dependent carboligase